MPAFSQPVFDMQRVFRVVLDAMSRPARLCRLPVFPQSVPDGLSPVLAALALTLCDGESPLWLSPGLRKDETTTWLRFHCGCPIVEEADKAAFALVADASELPPLSAFAQGVPAYPDRSATVLLAGLAFDAGTRFRGSGPGICGESTFTCTLPEDLRSGGAKSSGFPRRGHAAVQRRRRGGLPRTTRLERLPQESASCM
ncbi:MAG: phosphonate C-P lyase system protein PhnH [Bilophila wadsworthia]